MKFSRLQNWLSNISIICSIIVVLLIIGGIAGYILSLSETNVKKGISYGFIAFSILPISICLFGIKEVGGIFPGVAKDLKYKERSALLESSNTIILRIIFLGFLIVLLQVLLSFWLLYLSNNYEYIILGILFGGVLSSLIYGLYVCFSVRRLLEYSEKIIERRVQKEQHKAYIDTFNKR